MVHDSVLYDSEKSTCLGKNWSFSWPKIISTNQIAVFFGHQYLWKKSIDLLHFLHGDNPQEKVAFEDSTFGLLWPLYLLSNQIAGSFDYQYL